MEREITAVNNKNKRARGGELDDSDSPELKLIRVDSVGSAAVDSEANSPAENGNQVEDILDGFLDGTDDAAVQGLDLVVRSLEEEILAPAPEVSQEGKISLPELGYLLEASDYELGLPPAGYTGEESAGFAGLDADVSGEFSFDGEFPSYDSFDLELVGESVINGGDEFVTVGSLFEHSEDRFGTAADVSLSAL